MKAIQARDGIITSLFLTNLPVKTSSTRTSIIIDLSKALKYSPIIRALPPKAVLNPQLYEWLRIVRPPTARWRSGDHLHYLQVIRFTTPVGNLGDGHRLQVHHTSRNTENRGKKVANPDF